MKYAKILTFALIALMVQSGLGQGMTFETGNWASILKKAKKGEKLIYLDAYTSWCGPCKMMKKNVFPDASVGEYFNANFVNAQIDMEKGEGPGLAKKYNVNAYPTHLFVDANGDLVHVGLGYRDPAGFIELGKEANDPARQYASLKKQYEAGKRDSKLVATYMQLLAEMQDPAGDAVAAEYFKSQSDLTTPENVKLLASFAMKPTSPNHHLVLENKEVLARQLGSDFLNELAYYYFIPNFRKGASMEDAVTQVTNIYPEKADILTFYTKQYYTRSKKDMKGYEEALFNYLTPEHLDQFSSSELNSYAWYVYESTEGADKAKAAIPWAEASVAKKSEYANNDTLAWLYFKAGDVERAKEIARKAIELGKAAGEDTSSTEELLQK